jgi:hypothetical protein
MNLVHAVYRMSHKPNASRAHVNIERFSDTIVHMMMILLFLFTEFTSSSGSQTMFCFFYIGGLVVVFLVNVAHIIYSGVSTYLRGRKLKKTFKDQLKLLKKESVGDKRVTETIKSVTEA